uniref:Capsid protein n=1 Tax=viral metagenome TaxID=1070528 RepID=A0A6H1ZGH8_9ZZZZ
MAIISNAQSRLAGVQADLAATWQRDFPIYKEMQEAFLFYLPYTTIRNAPYAFKDRIPFPRPYPYGKGRDHQGFKDRLINVGLIPFELTLGWDRRDALDDQLKDLERHVSTGMQRYFQLPDVLIGEYMSGVAAYNIDGLQLCFDGVSLYSATDGDGNARFGVTGGNIITGQGVSTTARVMSDIIKIRRRFLEMKEPVTNQPLHNSKDIVYNNIHYIIPAHLDGIFSQIQEQELIYSDPTIVNSQSNMLKGKIKYTINQRLSADSNSFFAVLKADYWRPFAYRAPQDVNTIFATIQNSDRSREFAEDGFYSDMRIGIAPWCPFTTVKNNND